MSATCSVPSPVLSATCRPAALSRRTGALALAIRIAGAAGLFLSQIVLIRGLGVTGFGEYALAITWLQVLTVLGKLGLDNTSLRYVSEYTTKGETGKLHGFIRDSTRASLLASMSVMVGVMATVAIFRESIGNGLANCLHFSAVMIPLISLRQIQEACLRGVGRLFESQICTAIWPLTLCILAGIAWQTSSSLLSSPMAVLLHLVSVGVVSVLVYRFHRHFCFRDVRQADCESRRQQWTNTAMAFLTAEVLIVLKGRACVAMAGMLLDSKSVGIYGAMEKFADVSVLASQSLGLVIAPQFAALFAAGCYSEMRRLMWQGQILGLAFTLPVALGVAFFGDYVFLLIGPDYREGWNVLLALLASACIAAFSGPAAYVLQMTGHERTMLWITTACAATNILLSLLLMRTYGLLGLGIAQMATSLVWTVGVRWSLSKHPAWQSKEFDNTAIDRPIANEVSK